MAGEHSRLVHKPSGVVGTPHTGMVSEVTNPKFEIPNRREIYVGIEPPPDPENWIQDEDTVDTWFSSWLWAYETMDPKTRKKFYPTSVLVTAAGHHFLLGRANDHCRARVQTRQIQQALKTTFRFTTFSSPASFATNRAAKCRSRSAIRLIRWS